MHRLRESRGFTLIELMVVVMIIAVLLVVALPTFLGFRSRAQDSAAQHSLTVAQKTTFVVALQSNGFPASATLAATLPVTEPIYAWLTSEESSTHPGEVSVADDAGGEELALATRSRSGSCFYLRLALDASPVRHVVHNAAACQAADFRDGAGSGW